MHGINISGGVEMPTVDVRGTDVQAVNPDADTEIDADILGHVMMYTIGREFVVDDDWLVEQATEIGIPEKMLPNTKAPIYAFRRAVSERLANRQDVVPDDVSVEVSDPARDTYNLDVLDRRGDGGDLVAETVAKIRFDGETEKVFVEPDSDNPEYLSWVQDYASIAQNEYENMLNGHLGRDISRAVRKWIQNYTTGIRMRDAGAVYFIPAQYADGVAAWAELIDRINTSQKERNFEAAIDPIEVINSDDKKEMVERKARRHIRQALEKGIDAALDEMDEDTAATAAVSAMSNELKRSENVAAHHSALLEAELSVKQQLESWKENTSDRKKKIIQAAIDEVDI